jgi:predicted RNA binding protein YcfA (HicA-like mRNA interferase family)
MRCPTLGKPLRAVNGSNCTCTTDWKLSRASGSLPHVAGFTLAPGGKGSHRKFQHPQLAGSVILSGKDGDDAHHYQEKQVRQAIREAGK